MEEGGIGDLLLGDSEFSRSVNNRCWGGGNDEDDTESCDLLDGECGAEELQISVLGGQKISFCCWNLEKTQTFKTGWDFKSFGTALRHECSMNAALIHQCCTNAPPQPGFNLRLLPRLMINNNKTK